MNRNELFRQKSLEKATNPDNLDQYLTVTSPAAWMIMLLLLVSLSGILCWSIFGKIHSYVNTAVLISESEAIIYIKEDRINQIKAGQDIIINDMPSGEIESPGETPVAVNKDTINEYIMHLADIYEGSWVYEARVKLSSDLAPGVYPASIVIEELSPIKFIMG